MIRMVRNILKRNKIKNCNKKVELITKKEGRIFNKKKSEGVEFGLVRTRTCRTIYVICKVISVYARTQKNIHREQQ